MDWWVEIALVMLMIVSCIGVRTNARTLCRQTGGKMGRKWGAEFGGDHDLLTDRYSSQRVVT